MQTITDELTYDTLHSSEDNLWSVLLMTGYITKADAEEEGETVSLKIPNREIASIFEDTVVNLFKETIDTNMQKSMMEAFWNKAAEEAGRIVSELLWRTISYNDYQENGELAQGVDSVYGNGSAKYIGEAIAAFYTSPGVYK